MKILAVIVLVVIAWVWLTGTVLSYLWAFHGGGAPVDMLAFLTTLGCLVGMGAGLFWAVDTLTPKKP